MYWKRCPLNMRVFSVKTPSLDLTSTWPHLILYIKVALAAARLSWRVARFSHTTTRRPPDRRTETQTAVVRSCLRFIRSGQNHPARHSEREKKIRQTEEEVGRQHQGMDKPGVHRVPEGSGEQGKMEELLVAKSSLVPQRPSRSRD